MPLPWWSSSDGEGNLGLLATGRSVVPGNGDELVADDDDQRQPVEVVDICQVLELGFRQLAPRTEEPQVDRLGRQAGVQSLSAASRPKAGSDEVRPLDRRPGGRPPRGRRDSPPAER